MPITFVSIRFERAFSNRIFMRVSLGIAPLLTLYITARVFCSTQCRLSACDEGIDVSLCATLGSFQSEEFRKRRAMMLPAQSIGNRQLLCSKCRFVRGGSGGQ